MASPSTIGPGFVLEAAQSRRLAYLSPVTDLEVHPFDILSGAHTPVAPRTYRVESGVELTDLVFSSDLCPLLSDNAVRVLGAAGLDGWATRPAKIIGPPGMRGTAFSLVVTGRCAIVRPTPAERPRFQFTRGLELVEGSWTGHDLSVAFDTAIIFVTDRVREAVIEGDLTGFEFHRLTDVEYPL